MFVDYGLWLSSVMCIDICLGLAAFGVFLSLPGKYADIVLK
jgi:hypothetical protein